VPPGRWKGLDKSNSQGVLDAVVGSTSAESTIGILGSDFYDAHRDVLKSLAFQAFHQNGAYFADSTATSFDKRNVRNGHYINFGYLHLIAKVDAQGVPSTTQSKRFVDWVTGNTDAATGTPAPFVVFDITIKAKLIPQCHGGAPRGGDRAVRGEADVVPSQAAVASHWEERAEESWPFSFARAWRSGRTPIPPPTDARGADLLHGYPVDPRPDHQRVRRPERHGHPQDAGAPAAQLRRHAAAAAVIERRRDAVVLRSHVSLRHGNRDRPVAHRPHDLPRGDAGSDGARARTAGAAAARCEAAGGAAAPAGARSGDPRQAG
jgi:hypothetical protein